MGCYQIGCGLVVNLWWVGMGFTVDVGLLVCWWLTFLDYFLLLLVWLCVCGKLVVER